VDVLARLRLRRIGGYVTTPMRGGCSPTASLNCRSLREEEPEVAGEVNVVYVGQELVLLLFRLSGEYKTDPGTRTP
jgi:hypothetical protein